MAVTRPAIRTWLSLGLGGVVLGLLYLMSRQNYLLFHALSEMFSIAVAVAVFLVFWNSRRFVDNNYVLLIGIAYLFVAAIDLLHTLAYKDMGVFRAPGSNLATQLWIAARYMEALSLLAAPLLLSRRLRAWGVLAVYAGVTALLLLAIFVWPVFPVCYIDVVDTTAKGHQSAFKIASEGVISAILVAALILLRSHRWRFERKVLRLLAWSIAVTISSELCFAIYQDVFGIANMAGHLLKVVSFYLIYAALIQTGLRRPYDLLFKDLADSRQALQESEERFRQFFENEPAYCYMVSPKGVILDLNKAARQALEYEKEEIVGQPVTTIYVPEMALRIRELFGAWRQSGRLDNEELEIISKTGRRRTVLLSAAAIRDADGRVRHSISVQRDITDRKRVEREREAFLVQLEHERAQLDAVIESAPEGIVMVDRQAKVVRLNLAAELVYKGTLPTGYGPDDPAAARVCYPDGRPYDPRDLPMVRAALDGQTHRNLEIALVWPDGERRDLLENTAPIRDGQGRLSGAVGIFQDISEAHRFRAELLQRAEQLETLIHETHHRIRNNLQSVISLLELERDHVDTTSVASLDRCVSRIRAIAMVHRLLTTRTANAVPLLDLLKGLAELAEATYLGDADKQIEIGVTGRAVAVTSKAATSLAIVVNELITNAIQHAFGDRQHGRISVAVTGGRDQPISISVADNGCGCPQPVTEGTGLRVVRSIVEHDLGGQFSFQNLDSGCRCLITLQTQGDPHHG